MWLERKKLILRLFAIFGHPAVVKHEAQPVLLGLVPVQETGGGDGSSVVAVAGLAGAKATGAVVLWTQGALPRPEALGVGGLGAELTQVLVAHPVHAGGAGDAQGLSGLPTRQAVAVVHGLVNRTAIRDEASDLPVDPELVADVDGGPAGELLVKLVLSVADRGAFATHPRVHALHPAVVNVRGVEALVGRVQGVAVAQGREAPAIPRGGVGQTQVLLLHRDGEATPGLVAVGVGGTVQHVVATHPKLVTRQKRGHDLYKSIIND